LLNNVQSIVFETDLSRHVTEKARHSRQGAAMVKLRLTTGETIAGVKAVDVADGYTILEVYPEKRKERSHGKEERKRGAIRIRLWTRFHHRS
jgi:hypothetical protein